MSEDITEKVVSESNVLSLSVIGFASVAYSDDVSTGAMLMATTAARILKSVLIGFSEDPYGDLEKIVDDVKKAIEEKKK